MNIREAGDPWMFLNWPMNCPALPFLSRSNLRKCLKCNGLVPNGPTNVSESAVSSRGGFTIACPPVWAAEVAQQFPKLPQPTDFHVGPALFAKIFRFRRRANHL